jgi:uncharacterized phiE125 gp8 family phage protein
VAYAEIHEVKHYLGIGDEDSDDALLGDIITRAQKIIERYTGRVFEAVTATKYFSTDSIEGRYLYLWGYDLLTVTTLTNGDGTTIAAANYRLEPRNEIPKWQIRLDEDTDWEMDDSDSEVSIAGTWGYTTTVPHDIKHACIRLVAFLYRQKDTNADIDRPLVTGDGVTIMPGNLPADVKSLLDSYRRRI